MDGNIAQSNRGSLWGDGGGGTGGRWQGRQGRGGGDGESSGDIENGGWAGRVQRLDFPAVHPSTPPANVLQSSSPSFHTDKMLGRSLLRAFWTLRTESQSYSTVIHFRKSPLFVYSHLVDIDRYVEFIPWCKGSRVLTRREGYCEAELTIGFPPLSQSYISQVFLNSPTSVVSKSPRNAVFDVLDSNWQLKPPASVLSSPQDPIELTECEAHYSITFRFSSPIYNSLSQLAFDMVCVETSKSFERRINGAVGNTKCVYSPKLGKFI